MKSESNISVIVKNNELTWQSIFNGRVMSLEEAVARIFSFTFCDKDVICKFIDTSIPEKRNAVFDNFGKQKTFDDVEAYITRPGYLDNILILDFYSQYDIHYLPLDTDLSSYDADSLSKPGSIDGLFYNVKGRSNHCIVTFRNFDYMKQREEFLYHYLLVTKIWRYDPSSLLANEDDSYDTLFDEIDIMKVDEDNVDSNFPNRSPVFPKIIKLY